jgi:hypothetical protein
MLFGKTRQRIIEPVRKASQLAFTAIIIAIVTLVMVITAKFGQGA